MFQSSPVSYASVVESIGESFSGGAIQSRFMVGGESRGWVLWGNDMLEAPLNNTSSFLNGKVKEEIVFKKNDQGTLIPITRKRSTYKIDSIRSVYGYMVNRGADMNFTWDTTCNLSDPECQNSLMQAMKPFSMFKYEVASSWTHADSLIEMHYDENGQNPVVTSSKTYYDSGEFPDLVTKTESINSQSELIRIENKYPHNYTGTTVYDSMLNRNIISPVISNKTFNDGVIMSETKINYSLWTNGNYDPVSVEQSVKSAPLENEGTINLKDSHGNVLEFTGKDGIVNAIIWGYQYLYPVAKISGASYSQAIAQLSVTVADLQGLAGSTLLTELHRIRQGLPGAYVTSYSYKHLIGVESITDPNNNTVTYSYDSFNRLKTITDQDGNIIKSVDYNYAIADPGSNFVIYFNAYVSQNFNVQNCADGYLPTNEVYWVPSGRYFSLNSQADANAKAQADIAAYGQKFVNRIGYCFNNNSSSTCTGINKKVVNCMCETGVKVYTYSSEISPGLWQCTYHYEWSDGSWSQNYTEYSSTCCALCPIGGE